MSPINFKLINLLKSLTPKETNDFRKFVASPFYAGGRNYLSFLNELINFKSSNFENIDPHKLYEKIYPGKKFSNQTMKNRFSELYKLGEEFLIYSGLNQNKIEKDKLLIKMLIQKKLYKPYENYFGKVSSRINSEKTNKVKFRNNLDLYQININFLKEKNKVERIFKEYLEASHIDLCLHLINLFEHGVEFALQEDDNRKSEFNYITDFLKKLDVKELMKTFSRLQDEIYKITAMNYYMYKAYENVDDTSYYFEAHKLFTEVADSLEDGYKNIFFNTLIYYCIKKQNQGIKKFQFELFTLYNEKLEQGLLSDIKEKIYLFNGFRDYVYIGLAIKKYKWTEDFIRKYYKELPERFREDELKLSMAKLYFENKYFEKSLSSLNGIKTPNYLQYTDSSILKLCCYFEMNNYEKAYLEIDKLKHYLRNHEEIPKAHCIPIANFIKVYQKLINFYSDPGKDEIGYLEKELNHLKKLTKKDWLVEKISDFTD